MALSDVFQILKKKTKQKKTIILKNACEKLPLPVDALQ